MWGKILGDIFLGFELSVSAMGKRGTIMRTQYLLIDPATGELDIGNWYVTYLPTHLPTPPRTLPSWIIKANPSCY